MTYRIHPYRHLHPYKCPLFRKKHLPHSTYRFMSPKWFILNTLAVCPPRRYLMFPVKVGGILCSLWRLGVYYVPCDGWGIYYILCDGWGILYSLWWLGVYYIPCDGWDVCFSRTFSEYSGPIAPLSDFATSKCAGFRSKTDLYTNITHNGFICH